MRVHAAGINVGDAEIRSSELHERWPATFPSGQGSDFAGVAKAAGAAVTGVQRGDEVAGFINSRASHAELLTLPEDQLAMKPAGVSREIVGLPDTATESCGSRPRPATGSSGAPEPSR